MAKLLVAILAINLLGTSAIRTSIEDNRRRVQGTRLCQKQYGSYYFHDVFGCCPCSPCKKIRGSRPRSSISCIKLGADHCEAPYFTKCREIGPPIPSKDPTVIPTANATHDASPPVVTPTTNAMVVDVEIPAKVITKLSPEDSTFSVVLIAISVAILICVTLVLTCVCCYLRRGNHASKLIEKFPKWWGCSDDTKAVSLEKSSVSSCQPLIFTERPPADNGIHPSPHPSLRSHYGPSEMVIPVAVQPHSRTSSYDVSEGGSSLPHHSVTESVNYSGRHIVAHRGHSRDETTPPRGDTNVSGCNNVGLIATDGSTVVIHNLNFHCSAPDRNHLDFNITNQRIRVEAPGTPQRTFQEPNQVTGNRMGGHEHGLNRQSSEISSNSSGPVENETQGPSRFGDSIAFQDQVWEMRNCSQALREEHSIVSDSNASGPCMQRSTVPSYPVMSSDMSFNISQSNSSGLPPQSDMVKDSMI